MPKLKTHKGSVKRMKLTKRGKITAKRAGKGHLMSGKSSKRRRALSRKQTLSASVTRRYTRALTGR